MLAASYTGERTIVVHEAEPTPPGPGEVRLDVAFVGVCGTDLHIFHGAMDARVRRPAVIGHEMSGRVAAVGPGVEGWRPGDLATVMPLESCGDCAACRAGHGHVCQRLVFVGIDAAGALQESWTVHEHLLVRLPAGADLRAAALTEPVAVAVHDVRRAALEPGEKALVVGGGPIGALIAVVAAARRGRGAARRARSVPPIGGRGARLRAWRTPRTRTSSRSSRSGPAARARRSPSRSPAAVRAWRRRRRRSRVRGRLVVVGIHPQPVPVDLHRVFWRELTLIGARVYERADFETAVRLVADGSVPAEALISRVEPLARTPEAFAALESGGEVMKILIDCRS